MADVKNFLHKKSLKTKPWIKVTNQGILEGRLFIICDDLLTKNGLFKGSSPTIKRLETQGVELCWKVEKVGCGRYTN